MKLTKENISQVFKPAVPIRERNNFIGRTELLKILDRSLYTPGRQSIVFGERGVGKTSFVNIGIELCDSLHDYLLFEYNCSQEDTYHDIIGSILRSTDQLLTTDEYKYTEDHKFDGRLKIGIAEGGGERTESKEETKKSLIPASFTPNEIVKHYLMGKYILLIDEYDRIESSKTKRLLAETLKILSNYHSDTKLIICGVSNSAKSLIGDHLSNLRNICVIPIPKMTDDEILEIINTGKRKLGLEFSESLIKLILLVSNGLPFFTHLICEQLSYLALDNVKNKLDDNDFFIVLENILQYLPEHIKVSYELACSKKPTVFQIEQDVNTPFFSVLEHSSTVRKESLCIFSLVDDCDLDRAKKIFGYYIELGRVFEPDKYKSMDEILFHNILLEITKISDILKDYESYILFKDSYHRGYTLLEAARYFGKDMFMKLIEHS